MLLAFFAEGEYLSRVALRQHGSSVALAEALPVYKIDQDYITRLDDLPTPADKAAALEAMLTQELEEGEAGFTYRLLGERLQRRAWRIGCASKREQRLRGISTP